MVGFSLLFVVGSSLYQRYMDVSDMCLVCVASIESMFMTIFYCVWDKKCGGIWFLHGLKVSWVKDVDVDSTVSSVYFRVILI